MLSKRNLAMMLTMIVVVLALFLSSVVLKEYYNDYDVNHMAETEITTRKEQSNGADGDETDISLKRRVLYFGKESNGYFKAINEWAEYRKKAVRVFSSIVEADEKINTSENKEICLLIDGELLKNNTEESAEALAQYAEQGAVVIFYRMPSFQVIKDCEALQKLLGIQRLRAESVSLQEIRLYSGFLLGGETHYSFVGVKEPELADMEREIPWYDISGGTKTYMVGFLSDEEKSALAIDNEDMPAIIWRNNMGNGSVFAVNGDYMKDSAMGILDAMLYEAYDYSLYSVVNAQNLSITGFPDLTDENEKQMAEVYGMTAEQFCRDILWPSFVAAADKGDWRITAFASVKQSDSSENEPNMDMLIDYLKYFNEEKTEAGVSLGRIDSSDIRFSVGDEKSALEKLKLNYLFSGGYIRNENKDKLSNLLNGNGNMKFFSDIRTVVGEYVENERVLYWLTDKITFQNATANAYKHSYKDSLKLKSIETSLGYSNVQVDIYRVLRPESEKDQWENLADKMAANIATYWKPFSVFDKTTISQSDSRVRDFLNGSVDSSKNGDRISIKTEGFKGDAYLLLRTHGETPVSMTGGSWEQIEEYAYLLKLTSDTAYVTLKTDIEPYYYAD